MIEKWAKLSLREQLSVVVRSREDWLNIESIAVLVPRILGAMNRVAGISVETAPLEEYCRRIHEGSESLITESSSVEIRGPKGLIGEYPQHAALRELARRPNVSPWLIECAALLIVCSDQWDEELHTLSGPKRTVRSNEFQTWTANAWRSVRLLREEVISDLPAVPDTSAIMKAELSAVRENSDARFVDSRDDAYLSDLMYFFAHFMGVGTNRVRDSSCKGRAVQSERVNSSRDSDSEVIAQPAQWIATQHELKEIRQTDTYSHGNSPQEELLAGPLFCHSEVPTKVGRGETTLGAVFKNRAQGMHRRKAAQLLPGRWDELNDNELSKLLNHLGRKTTDEPLLVALMVLVLLTGRSPEVVLKTRVVKTLSQLPKKPKPNELYLVYNHRIWVTGVLYPEARRKRKAAWRSVLLEHEEDIHLAVPEKLWACLKPAMGRVVGGVRSKSVALFKKNNLDERMVALKEFLSRLNKGRQARLTLHRVEHILFSALTQESSDVVEACLVSGKEPPFGQTAAIYYHSCDREYLADQYERVARRWSSLMIEQATHLNESPGNQRSFIPGSVGSNLSLEPSAVRQVVKGLRDQLNVDRELLGVPGGLQRFHNAFTNYCLTMTLFGTGYRVVVDPIARESDINLSAGTLVIADKTGDDMGHSRVVPLCPMLATQLMIYKTHVRWLVDHLYWAGAELSTAPHFFYLDPELTHERLRPSSMADKLEWAYPLPLNLGRHLLRGELRARGVSGVMVDRFMGHWGIGQEPWGRYSGADPLQYQYVVGKALELIMNDLEFIPEWGAVR